MIAKELLKEWIIYQKNFIKESTYANYINIINNHLIPDLGDKSIESLTSKLIQDYVLNKLECGSLVGGPMAIKSVRDIITVLKTSMFYAVDNEYLKSFEMKIRYPKIVKKNKPQEISNEDIIKLTEYCINCDSQYLVGVLLSLYTGMRIGEICALRYSDINLTRMTINVERTLQRIYYKEIKSKVIEGTPKSSSSIRSIPFPEIALSFIKEDYQGSRRFLLTNSLKSMEPRVLRKKFAFLLEKKGITHYTFHTLRHTFASMCIRNGVDYKTVAEILGHSNINTTMNLYVHSTLDQKKAAINKVINLAD